MFYVPTLLYFIIYLIGYACLYVDNTVLIIITILLLKNISVPISVRFDISNHSPLVLTHYFKLITVNY